jgi:hypothetical protein
MPRCCNASFPVHYLEFVLDAGAAESYPGPVTFGPGMVCAAVGGWQLWRYRPYGNEPSHRTHRSLQYRHDEWRWRATNRASSTAHDVRVEFDAADSLMRYERTSYEYIRVRPLF